MNVKECVCVQWQTISYERMFSRVSDDGGGADPLVLGLYIDE